MLLAGGWQGARNLKVLCGGEALPADLSAQLRGVVAELWNVYGPTETTIWSTCRRVSGACTGVAEPIGRPIANTQVYVLDAQLQPVPLGAVGELYIGGAGVARGYLDRAELTAERFVNDPFCGEAGARMYKTGDLARWRADGQLEYLGRNDFQVKVRGFRIELGEIETRLAACAGVRQAVVAAREDVPGDQRLVAYLIADEGATLDMGALRGELLAQLPEYMVPSAFLQMEAFPLTPNNKLDRKALPAPDAAAVIRREYEAPQGAAEEAIAAVWQELLGVERVGRRDHFFELGGHSLLAVQAIGRLREKLGVEVPLRALFDRAALADFAALLPAVQRAALPAIAAADRSQPLPLSFPQQRLWFLDQLNHEASAAYHMPAALRLSGRLDKAALRAALDRIVARHEVLRTCFVQAGGEAVQVIAAAAPFALTELDLSHLSGHEQRHALSLVALEEQAQPFDMAQGPLIRGHLVRLADDEHVLYVTQHHIVSDAWSVGLLVREASALYAAFSQGQADPLPPLALQYADYAAWQRGQLQGAALQAHTDYWRGQLAGAPALLELPADRPRPAAQQYDGGRLHFTVPAAVAEGLRALGQRHGATLFMTLFAGWSALLSRLSGQDDVVVGTPVANRPRTELEPLIGFFVNTLALRVRLDGDPSVAGLLARVRSATLGAWEHQDLPFEQLVDAVQPARSMSYSPLFQVLFSMDNTPAQAALELPGLRIEAVEQAGASTQFDLVLAMSDGADGLVGSLTYASALFERETAERMAGHFLALLGGMAADEQTRLSALPLLTAEQRRQLLVDFNATDAVFPTGQLAHQLFEAQAAARPEAVALVFDEHKLSYGQMNRRANQVAQRLLQLGVRPDERVALCVERGLDLIIGMLGILKAGGAYVPLDPAYPAERLAHMLEDSAPVAMVSLARLAGRPAAAALPQLLLDEEAAALAALPDANLEPRALGLAPHHLAYVIYTSGSTGKPKGVMNEHAGLCNLVHAQAQHYGVKPDSRVLQFVSVSFDVCISEVTMALCQGATLVLASNADLMPGEPLLATLRRHRVTHASMPTAVLGTLPFDADLGAVHTLIVGGEAMPPALAEHWSARATLFNAYGPTEAAVCTALHRCEGAQGAVVPIGRPTANTRMYVLDAAGQPVPLGVAGELHIGGAQVARGYLHRPELTAQRFVADPFSGVPGARLYRTGDLVRWQPDGTLLYLGRNDFQVKLRGFRIELGEIEARLAACDGVREALVLCREDSPGDKRLVAYVVPHDGAALAVAMLRASLAESLAEHMLPSAFVLLDALPLTANGKVDRGALPAPAGRTAGAEYVAPRNATEETLCRVWSALLQLERIGINDNFFESGGHSLLLVKLHAELGQLYPQRLALSDYFKYTTVAALAAFLEQEAQPAAGAEAQAAEAGSARAAARRAAQQGNRGRRTMQ
jgi:amino acid adenylation domain-containing protein